MRILSWNIQWGRGADGNVSLQRTIDRIRACGAVDAICLQEVAGNWPGLKGMAAPEDGPARLAAAFPDHQAVFAPGLERGDGAGGTIGFGNMMLLARPVGQIRRLPLPAPCDPAERSLPRACLEVVLENPAAPLRLLTTHLEYYSGLQRRAQVAALRQIQLEALAEAAQARSPRRESLFGAPARPPDGILCGDLNFAPDAAEMAALVAPGDDGPPWCDAWPALHGGQAHAPSVGLHGAEWPDHQYCCDYFFVTPGLLPRLQRIEVLADTDASDHQPVLLELAD